MFDSRVLWLTDMSNQTGVSEADSIYKKERWWRKKSAGRQSHQGNIRNFVRAVLFYNKLKGVLTNMGFEINDYNECTFNKMINGKQCTIQFHVDDLKLSNLQQQELDKIVGHLNDIFGSEGELLAASYGKIQGYLGMTVDWSVNGKDVFIMYDCTEDILAEAPDEFDGEDVTPAVSDLF